MIAMADPREYRRAYPAGATLQSWTAPDGWPLRVFDWPAEGERRRGAILFQVGRGDFVEKYLETLAHWQAAGWHVTALDWRGQAGSGRLTSEPQVGHVGDFSHYLRDLAAFWRDWNGRTPGPHVAIGHSMGGHLILRALAESSIAPDAAVLVAPMLGLRAPGGARVGEALARLLGGLGRAERAAWKGNERPYTVATRQTLLTHDADRYADEQWWQAENPALVTGPPSWRWLIQAFESGRRLRASPLEQIAVPVQVLVAEADRLVDPAAALAVARRLPDARVVRFGAESAHEILREVDPVRSRAVEAIDTFLDARVPRR